MSNPSQQSALSAALASLREHPDNPPAWDELETLAAEQQAPEPVAELYAEVLARDLPSSTARKLGERALRFCEEWFADDAPQMQAVLLRVFGLDAADEAVLDRLVMGLTAAGQWKKLLDVYAQAIEATDSLERQIQLLEDAARVAKDLADDADRAIAFLEKLVPLRPGDQQLRASYERLLERGERFRELIALWDSGVSDLPPDEAERVQVQIATCWLDKLRNPPAALEVMQRVLAANRTQEQALTLTERILNMADAAPGTRRAALALLRKVFEAEGQSLRVARVLRAGLAFASGAEREALHADAAAIFSAEGENDEALIELGRLFELRPDDEALEARIVALAEAAGRAESLVDILVRAAGKTRARDRAGALLLRAATLAHGSAGDVERAIELCEQVFNSEVSAALALDAGRALDALLESKNRSDARVRVLERLSQLEVDKERKREVLGALAKLARGQGDSSRAAQTWQKRLDVDPTDREALDGLVALYEANADHTNLVEALRARATVVGGETGAKDLSRIAELQIEVLEDLEAAIATWSSLKASAPDLVLGAKVSTLLDRAASREAERGARLLAALGDAYRELVGDHTRALQFYARAIAADRARADARRGLCMLLEDDSVRAQAADVLAGAYASSDDVTELLGLLPHRLFGATDPSERARLLRQAAQLEEQRQDNPAQAFAFLCEALAQEPSNSAVDAELFRLAEQLDCWQELAEALSSACAGLDASHARARALRASEAELWEMRLGSLEQAYEAYVAAAGKVPDATLASAICRTAAQLGRFNDAFAVVVQIAHTGDREPDELLSTIEANASSPEALTSLCDAAEPLIEQVKLEPPLKRALLARVASWREQAGDANGAEALLVRATGLGAPHMETLRRLLTLQRHAPGRALYDTLLKVAELASDDLDPLVEAVEIAVSTLEDAALAKPALERLFSQASALLVRGLQPTGKMRSEDALCMAVDKLADMARDAGDARVEVTLLREASALPVAKTRARDWSERAAQVAASTLADQELAISLRRQALELVPDDTAILAALAEQYAALGRLDELLVVRRRELALTQNVARRLELRLDIARVMGDIEARGGRLGALQDNLRDSPGHAASIEALDQLLRARSDLAGVHALLAEQAAQVEALGDGARAAELWAQAARLADVELEDQGLALAAYQKVAALSSSEGALEALARIRLARGEPQLALPWLERRLSHVPESERVGIRVRMARAHHEAGNLAAATKCLVDGLKEAPTSFELRDLLAATYREAGRFEELATLLADSAARTEDASALLAYAREAAALFCDQLGQPDRAVDVLSRAVEADPEDKPLRCLYADGLTAAGRLDEARTVLDAMVQSFGRRRSPERAEVHLRLARVAQAQGEIEEALSQLDTASGMDRSHLGILRALGALAQEAGQLERAERAYRSLLMAVRKPTPGVEPEVAASEVLYHLHMIARELGQTEKAAELLESAVQSAAQSDFETRRFKQLLLDKGEPAVLMRVLEHRLSQVQNPETEAQVLSDLADVLEIGLKKPEEALTARLKALACAPQLDELHEATLRVAGELSQLPRYTEALRHIIERARRRDERALVSDLALRAGAVHEHSLGQLEEAEARYKLVEAQTPGYIEAQFSLARVAGALGHRDEERAVLERIATLDDDPVYAAGKRSARYRLLELEVQDPEARERGLEAVARLVNEDPDFVRAGEILEAACDADPNDMRALELLEQVARKSDEPRVLLNFLERHARADDASLGLVREGAELALSIGELDRSEKLLLRAIELAERGDGIVEAVWAASALARLRRQRGDFASAMEWLEKAMHASDSIEGFDLGLELAALAETDGNDIPRAARIYEGLRERDPADRRAWEPLLEIYREVHDLERVNELVRATLEALVDPEERNKLRLDTARRMFEAGREEEGAALLHDVLGEDPDHEEATLKLADLYEKNGENEALADLLSRKLESARERRSQSLIPISLRMGGLLSPTQPEQALEIYREALLIIPESPELMRAAIDGLDSEADAEERAALLERYLHTEGRNDSDALTLALWLMDYHTQRRDEESFEDALAIAYRIAPSHTEIRDRLEQWYRARNDYANLAQFLEQEASNQQDRARSVALLTEAADLRLDKLSQSSEAAALLRKAREFAPNDFELLKRAVYASAASGELGPALSEVDAALEDPSRTKRERVELLLLRAEVASSAGMHDDAVASLDAAYADGGAAVMEHLLRGIEGARVAAKERNNAKRERELTLRMVGLLHQAGDVARSIELLVSWVQRVPNDVEALRALLELLMVANRWTDVVKVAQALIKTDAPEVLPRISERLVAAARAVERPELARPGLEAALERSGRHPKVVALLVDVYGEIGASRELAALLMQTLSREDPPEKRFEALRRIGQLLLDAGDVDGALTPLTQALEIRPDDVPTVLFIADAHIAARRFQQAQDLLDRTMNAMKQRRSPELASLRHRMARLSAAAGDAQARLEWLNSALEADMNNGDVASELAVVAQNMGQLDIALKALRAITMLKTDCPMSRAEAFYRQAVIVAQKGEPRRAVLWAKKAKQEDAAFPGVDKLLAELGEG